jgi:hypothetical protein
MVMLSGRGLAAQISSGTPRSTKSAKISVARQQQQMLDDMAAKIAKLEAEQTKYGALQAEIDQLKSQLDQANRTAASAQQDAAMAKQDLSTLKGRNDEAVAHLQSAVNDMSKNSVSIAESLQTEQTEVKALEAPDAIAFKRIKITPIGFLAGETVWRQRGIGGDINTSFATIPFAGQTAGDLSEFNASGRQSRVAMLAEGNLPNSKFRGYFESDFLSAGTTSNDNQSNSYTLRVRQAWGQAQIGMKWDITTGQMWSLATEDKAGLANLQEAIPQTIDAQYTVGFTWARQYGFRATRKLAHNLWIASSFEAAQTLNIGGHNLPTIAYQQAGNAGGLYNPTANYSFNYAPDLLAKIAYQPNFGHFELFGLGRFFRDRVFPNGPTPPGAPQPPTPSALGAYTAKATGAGVGANGRISLLAKSLDLGAHIMVGDGIGRYSSATLPDATAHPDGSLELLTGSSALGSLEWHTSKRLDLYAYYGGEYAKRAYYNTGYFVTTPGPTQGQPILGGYGAPTNPVYGCHIEVLPVTSSNGGGNVPGAAANCQADNRNIQEGTAGYWYRFYQGTRGTFQQGIQYSYLVRHTWQGIGDPLTGLGGSPKAIDNMIFTSFRYYLPK